jgi:hypothetical protein
MRSQAYLTLSGALRAIQLTSLVLALAVPFAGCGGDDDDDSTAVGPKPDGGTKNGQGDDGNGDLDASYARPITVDAGMDEPGDPPAELADQSCAVDTNKLYDLITFDRLPEPTRLGVDVVDSRFALAYVDKSEACIDAVYVAELDGAVGAGAPKPVLAIDPCSIVDRAAVEYDGKHWLLGTIDARKNMRDLWVQELDVGSKHEYDAYNVTDSAAAEREFALLSLGEDGVLAAWVEDDGVVGGAARLKTRMLSASGKPEGEPSDLEQPEDVAWTISGLSMAALGTDYVGLVYRRADNEGRAELVLDVLSRGGERDRDPWVLSEQAGAYGTIDVAAGDNGAGAIYSIVQGTSEQLWFQGLGLDGKAVSVTTGGQTGGPAEARRIVSPPYKASDASLVKLPNGFAVAYRALPGGDVTSARIRVHFLDNFGRILDKSDVALAEPQGGRTAIKVAYDGRVVIGWSDTDDAGKTTLTTIKLPCVGAP